MSLNELMVEISRLNALLVYLQGVERHAMANMIQVLMMRAYILKREQKNE